MLVVEDGGSGDLLEAVGSCDVVDVSVGDEDLLDDEVVFSEEGEDVGNVVAWVDDDGFVGGLVAEDGAVALEGTDGDDFVNHGSLSGDWSGKKNTGVLPLRQAQGQDDSADWVGYRISILR